MDADYFLNFKADLQSQDAWEAYHRKLSISPVPPVPEIDAEHLFWTMMSISRQPDPYMYPALQKLKASNKFHLAALSNTSIFPEGHEFNKVGKQDVRKIFDVFVSSAHVGMRKPNRDIYDYTIKQLREKWGKDLEPGDVVFLDDIGENLKMGKKVGFRTVKVVLGKTDHAVRELEKITGLDLLESKPKL